MRFCSQCGAGDHQLIILEFGGCGGFGEKIACGKCGTFFRKDSDGITAGNETWTQLQHIPQLEQYHRDCGHYYHLTTTDEVIFNHAVSVIEQQGQRFKITSIDRDNQVLEFSIIGQLQPNYLQHIQEILGDVTIVNLVEVQH